MPLRACLLPLALPLLLVGCASAVATDSVATGLPLVLSPGERVALPPGAQLRFVGVSGDSRCPPGVQCVHAGDATATFEFDAADAAPERVDLNTAQDPAEARVGPWRLRLIELGRGPAPDATVRIDPAR